ncbi:C-type lectin protein [Ranid herpesvirus 3]|uniref:C-type lectin protein n=1 Tax=Ranid herpesvirus 3 TaxID=1987509 RepID=A0A1X9T5H8_9VIRU|nr:C-type lectin protein [Ranid herpesvirus 3]ARR28959.1 C-type lectin protein [Ranid herpesvirus 3]
METLICRTPGLAIPASMKHKIWTNGKVRLKVYFYMVFLICTITALLFIVTLRLTAALSLRKSGDGTMLTSKLLPVVKDIALSRNGLNCPAGWIKHKNRCHHFSDRSMTYFDVPLYCSEMMATPFIIDHPVDVEVLQRRVKSAIWVGLTLDYGVWSWFGGSSVEIYKDIMRGWIWHEHDLSTTITNYGRGSNMILHPKTGLVVSEADRSTNAACSVTVCPPTWVLLGENCFGAIDRPVSYNEAVAICDDMNATLANPFSANVANKIVRKNAFYWFVPCLKDHVWNTEDGLEPIWWIIETPPIEDGETYCMLYSAEFGAILRASNDPFFFMCAMHL